MNQALITETLQKLVDIAERTNKAMIAHNEAIAHMMEMVSNIESRLCHLEKIDISIKSDKSH